MQPLKAFVDRRFLDKRLTDPNSYLVGCHVRVIHNSDLKAYHGIIKEVQRDDYVMVKLMATSQQHRVKLSNLAML